MKGKHVLPLLCGLTACGSSRIVPPPSPDGAWTVSISVAKSQRRSGAIGKEIAGIIRLQPKISTHTSVPNGRFGYFGTFAIDFRPVGGWLIGTSDTTPLLSICGSNRSAAIAAASAGWDDSVHVVLNPCADHGRVVLDGVWRGDHVGGRWYEGISGGSSGTFVMRRARS